MATEKTGYEQQLEIVLLAYQNGMRSRNLGDQPAPWMIKGLLALEYGQELTIDDIRKFNLSGGTDHPDPWFG